MYRRIAMVAGIIFCAVFNLSSRAWAEDVRNFVDQPVPVLKDGTKMTLTDVEQAILAACKRYEYEVIAEAPGNISARWKRNTHSFDVSITYTADRYSIVYLDSVNMDYNPVKQKIDSTYNGYVAGLAAHVRGQLARVIDRMKAEAKQRKAAA